MKHSFSAIIFGMVLTIVTPAKAETVVSSLDSTQATKALGRGEYVCALRASTGSRLCAKRLNGKIELLFEAPSNSAVRDKRPLLQRIGLSERELNRQLAAASAAVLAAQAYTKIATRQGSGR